MQIVFTSSDHRFHVCLIDGRFYPIKRIGPATVCGVGSHGCSPLACTFNDFGIKVAVVPSLSSLLLLSVFGCACLMK